jgi:hypothetical protein
MIANAKELYKYIDGILKPAGYVRKKETYYLHTEDCICYFVVLKSDYGGKYGTSMGCFYKKLLKGSNDYPPYYQDNLRMSLSALAGKDLVRKVLDLEGNEFIKSERETKIAFLVEKYVIPFIGEIGTRAGIVRAIGKYEGDRYQLMADLAIKRELGIPIED